MTSIAKHDIAWFGIDVPDAVLLEGSDYAQNFGPPRAKRLLAFSMPVSHYFGVVPIRRRGIEVDFAEVDDERLRNDRHFDGQERRVGFDQPRNSKFVDSPHAVVTQPAVGFNFVGEIRGAFADFKSRRA